MVALLASSATEEPWRSPDLLSCPAMLRFEREVVTALGSALDQPTRSAVEAFVDGSLRAMSEPARFGILAETLLLGSYVRLRGLAGRPDGPDELRARLERWETGPVGLVRLYVRLFRSLVLLSENELSQEPV
jgi:hypothetical protein